jgi:carboxypeptidase family protein
MIVPMHVQAALRAGLGACATFALLIAAACGGANPAPVAAPRAQQPPPTPPAPPIGTGQISGRIRSAIDDAPLARARIVATSPVLPEPRVTISASDGRYLLTDLPAGAYTVTVARTGFAPQAYGQTRPGTSADVVLASGQQVTGIDVVMIPGAAIVGRILDEDGEPFAGAQVDALVTRYAAGTDTLVSVATAATDDRGEFRLYGLKPGQYYVSALDPAFRSVSTPRGVLHYSPTYSPGVTFADQAKPVVVPESGPPPRVEFRLKLTPPARVSGQLVPSDHRQLLNGAVTMTAEQGEGIPIVPPEDVTLLPDGRFTFGHVAPGRYRIRARGQTDPSGAALFAVFSTIVDGVDIDGVRMMLQAGAVVDGTLSLEPTHSTPPPLFSSLRIRAPFIDGDVFGDALTGNVQQDGTFVLRGLMAGSHQLLVEGLRPPWVLKRILLHGADITDLQLDVDSREEIRGVRVILTDAPSEVSGTVQNAREAPVANAGVLVYSRAPAFWMHTSRRVRVVYTDRNGRFSVEGLPAGEYLAVASMNIDESDLGRRDRLRSLMSIATPFELPSDNGRAAVDLRLASAPPVPVR